MCRAVLTMWWCWLCVVYYWRDVICWMSRLYYCAALKRAWLEIGSRFYEPRSLTLTCNSCNLCTRAADYISHKHESGDSSHIAIIGQGGGVVWVLVHRMLDGIPGPRLEWIVSCHRCGIRQQSSMILSCSTVFGHQSQRTHPFLCMFDCGPSPIQDARGTPSSPMMMCLLCQHTLKNRKIALLMEEMDLLSRIARTASASRTIQRVWRKCISDPTAFYCKHRLLREYQEWSSTANWSY